MFNKLVRYLMELEMSTDYVASLCFLFCSDNPTDVLCLSMSTTPTSIGNFNYQLFIYLSMEDIHTFHATCTDWVFQPMPFLSSE